LDWYLDEEVFLSQADNRKELILLGASHLNRIASHLITDNGR
jgi:hypothetical protein